MSWRHPKTVFPRVIPKVMPEPGSLAWAELWCPEIGPPSRYPRGFRFPDGPVDLPEVVALLEDPLVVG